MAYILKNDLSATPVNCNVGYANSWIHVPNDANRELFAQASYVTNFEDFTVSLSTGNVNIGAVEIKDGNSGAKVDVVSDDGVNALRVLSQDLESSVDDITIGDKGGRFATVDSPTSALNVKLVNPAITFADSPNLDAFCRLRVSNPYTLFDSKSLINKERYFWNSKSRNGDEVFNANDSSRTMRILNTDGFFVKETYRRFGYQPGKSQLTFFTGVVESEIDVIKRIGLFQSLSGNDYTDQLQGIYFQAYKTVGMSDDQSYAWVINNDSNLVPSQSAVQANWNLDKMDGTGPSKIILDFSKSQIFVMDFEWLGVGRVRCGFVIDGSVYYCHQFLNANNINGTYLRIPNNPLRAEIRSVGAMVGSMKTICASIMSEGGEDPSFVTRSVSTSAMMNVGVNNRRAILGVRLDPTKTVASNKIIDISSVCDTGNASSTGPYKVELIFRPTPISGVNWTSVNNSSSLQYANAPTSGFVINSGTINIAEFASNNSSIDLNKQQYDKTLQLGRDLDGNPDEVWLVVTPLVAAVNGIWASMTFAEAD